LSYGSGISAPSSARGLPLARRRSTFEAPPVAVPIHGSSSPMDDPRDCRSPHIRQQELTHAILPRVAPQHETHRVHRSSLLVDKTNGDNVGFGTDRLATWEGHHDAGAGHRVRL